MLFVESVRCLLERGGRLCRDFCGGVWTLEMLVENACAFGVLRWVSLLQALSGFFGG